MTARVRRTWSRRVRTGGAALLAGFAVMAITSVHTGASAETAPTPFVSLQGAGSWSVWENVVPWQNEMSSASQYVDFNYTKHGSLLGREDLVDGDVDFAITGAPFTSDELKKVKGGASDLISAPVQVATLATFVEPQYLNGHDAEYQYLRQICDPDADPETWPPGVTNFQDCLTKATYNGPVRIPNKNLAAMYAQYKTPASPWPSSWNSVDTLKAFGLDPATDSFTTATPNTPPGVVGRSDPDEMNLYLSMFMKFASPEAAAVVGADGPTERTPRVVGVTSDGAEQQLAQLAQNGCGVGTGVQCGANIAPSGGIAAAPPSGMRSFNSAFPDLHLDLAQMQNANGDWVGPTSDSINKAVAAGGETPLYALDHKVDGAYPLVWVDKLYAPAHGLSPQKTEGLAMLIRYLATTGQENNAKIGEGRLTQDMVNTALASANELVTSNCVGNDRKLVVDNEIGPLAPPTATAMQSISGEIRHCVAVPKPATTTTTTTPQVGESNGNGFGGSNSSDPGFGGSSSSDGGSSSASADGNSNSSSASTADGSNTAADVVGDASSDGSSSKVKVKNTSVLLTATSLPMPPPTGRSGADRLGAFLLGVFLFLLLRKPVQRLFSKGVG